MAPVDLRGNPLVAEVSRGRGLSVLQPYLGGPQAVVDNLLAPLARDWSSFSVTTHEFLAVDERVVSFGYLCGHFP